MFSIFPSKKSILILLGMTSLVFLQACAKVQYIEGVTLENVNVGGSEMAQLQVSVNSLSISLPSEINFPIQDPSDMNINYGDVALMQGTNNTVVFQAQVNLSEIAGLSASAVAKLPNGNDLPIVLPSGVSALEIPIKNSSIKLYIAGGPGAFMVGAAFPIAELDALGKGISIEGFPIALPSIFIPFSLPKDVSGSAGIFASQNAGENGFAFFLELAGLAQAEGVNFNQLAATTSAAGKTSFNTVSSNLGVEMQINDFMTKTVANKKLNLAAKKVNDRIKVVRTRL